MREGETVGATIINHMPIKRAAGTRGIKSVSAGNKRNTLLFVPMVAPGSVAVTVSPTLAVTACPSPRGRPRAAIGASRRNSVPSRPEKARDARSGWCKNVLAAFF